MRARSCPNSRFVPVYMARASCGPGHMVYVGLGVVARRRNIEDDLDAGPARRLDVADRAIVMDQWIPYGQRLAWVPPFMHCGGVFEAGPDRTGNSLAVVVADGQTPRLEHAGQFGSFWARNFDVRRNLHATRRDWRGEEADFEVIAVIDLDYFADSQLSVVCALGDQQAAGLMAVLDGKPADPGRDGIVIAGFARHEQPAFGVVLGALDRFVDIAGHQCGLGKCRLGISGQKSGCQQDGNQDGVDPADPRIATELEHF